MRRIIILVILLTLVFLLHCSKQEKTEALQWKGTIEEEEGVKVVKNPDESFYGEVTLDLEEDISIGSEEDENYMFYRVGNIKVDREGSIFILDSGNHRIQKFDKNGIYLQTIGKKGQGPGEFEMAFDMYFDDQENIYVSEGRKIQKFSPEGEFVKSSVLPMFILQYAVNPDGNIFASAFVSSEKGQNFGIVNIDSSGKLVEKICEFPGISMVARKGAAFSFSHAYSSTLCFSSLNGKGIIYGYSSKYKLWVTDEKGKSILIIRKDEAPTSISRKEKNTILDKVIEDTGKEGREWPRDVVEEGANFPKHRPYFSSIFTDSEWRIYIKKVKSVLEQNKEIECDVFSKDGYYLYKARLPFMPRVIKDGYLYHTSTSEETGEIKIIRYKISNWTKIHSGIGPS